MSELALNKFQYLELEKIGLGAFAPLDRFMNEDDVGSVADTMRLPSGQVFPLPVVLDLSPQDAHRLKGHARIALTFEGQEVGSLSPESLFRPNKPVLATKIFGTDDDRVEFRPRQGSGALPEVDGSVGRDVRLHEADATGRRQHRDEHPRDRESKEAVHGRTPGGGRDCTAGALGRMSRLDGPEGGHVDPVWRRAQVSPRRCGST